ncbi:MAG: hypothetical protein ACREH8_05460 [Opitutaceae bacterium]
MEGLRYYDLIWPSLMLMVGMAIPFSFARRSLTQGRGRIMLNVWKRALILFLLGRLRRAAPPLLHEYAGRGRFSRISNLVFDPDTSSPHYPTGTPTICADR